MPLGTRLEPLHRLTAKGFRDREAVLRYQSRRLRSLVRHAAENVLYYQRLFEQAGVDPNDFRGLPDLDRLPLSSKDDLLACQPNELVSRELGRGALFERTTSGSTGRPLKVRCTWFEERFLSALRFKVYRNMGIDFLDRIAHIRFVGRGAGSDRWLHRFQKLGLLRIARLDSSLSPQEIARQLAALQPDVIRGYSNLTSLVADAVLEECMTVQPKIVTIGGDILTEHMRSRISAAFRAPIWETYGSHECNLIAWECPKSRALHVCEEGVVLEVIRDGRTVAVGERGEVVATALHSFAQPFIRYRLGDIATRGAEVCSCGLPYSTIESIDGRIYDRIILPDGRAASAGDVLAKLERGFDWLEQYQMIQESRELVILRLVPAKEPASEDLELIHRMMEQFLGPRVRHRVDLLPSIPLAPGEKFRASMSKVFSNYDGST